MKKLYDLEAAEVSLVPRGANKKKFLIFKSIKGSNTMDKELLKLLSSNAEAKKKVEEILKSYMKKEEPTKEEGDKPAEGEGMSDRAKAALKAMERIAHPFKEEKGFAEHADKMMKSLMGAGKECAEGDVEKDTFEATPAKVEGEEKDVLKEHVEEAKKAGETAYKEHLKKLGYQKYPDAEMAMKEKNVDLSDEEKEGEAESMEKSKVTKEDGSIDLSALPKEARAVVEAIYKSNQEQVKKAAELEKDLKAERELRVKKEFVEKAKTFKNLGTETEELAMVLKSLHEKDPANYEKIEKTLRAADEQIGKGGLFSEIGSSLGNGGASEAEAKIEKAVESIVLKSDGKTTKEQAYEKFISSPEGQRLYAEMKAGRKDGI